MTLELGEETIQRATPEREFSLSVPAVAVFIWLFKVIEYVIPAYFHPSTIALSTDDAMRLAQVRDLLTGQPWYDLTQWRMNVPFGLPMHWSRLIDAPIAGLILLFRQFLAPQSAETLAICLWPMLSLLAAWLAIGRIAQHLAGLKAGVIAVLFGAAAAAVLGYFTPGVIDHHNVQVALTLWTLAFLIEIETNPRAANAAALLSVLSLAIGLEVLPYVVTSILIIGALWISRGDEFSGAVRRFGLTFSLAAPLALVLFAADHERFSAACDAYSGFYATLATFGGLGLASVTLLAAGTPVRRALLFIALGVAALVLVLAIAPACLAGPYGNVSPRINEIFLSRVQEVQSPILNAANDWPFFFYGTLYSAFGLLACIFAVFLVQQENRLAAIIVAAFAAMAFAVMSVEVRGVLFALLASLPGLAAATQLSIERWIRPGWRAALATIVALILFSNVSLAYAVSIGRNLLADASAQAARAKADSESWYCFSQASVTQLAAQPRARVVAFLDQGPAILAYSAHSVIAGPYHRNEQGILDT
ncbi:MAG TPA: hypothetical protein VGQ40_07225, partial [Chthoniobacterales bacterium]|nr:hypothetical protein [Chthoniobacterales bacterium]